MEIIFFYSMYSKKCQPVLSFIREHGINVTPCCVDSKDVKTKIKNGQLFKIKGVPTIVVVYDQEAEIYEGEKVLQWFDELMKTKAPQSAYQEFDEPYEDEYQEAPQPQRGLSSSLISRNSKEKQMDSVKNIAQQMEIERKRSLGYDESKLPYN